MALPQETASPEWIPQTERLADTAKWVFAGIAGLLGILLLIGAVRRGHSKSQSNKAMDHLEGANYRDYSVAPRRGKRNEVISGEEERGEETAGTPETDELPQAEPEKEEQGSDLMAETLKRLYDETAEGVKDGAEKAGEAAEEAAEAAEEAAEKSAEDLKAETEPAAQSMQEATRRRRAGRQ